ncbi:MAG: hypothetical protein AAF633_05450 [Chloroflexota bacterium]
MEQQEQEKKKLTPQEIQKIFLQVLSAFLVVFLVVMVVGMAFDAFQSIRSILPSSGPLLAEPMIWHKLGEFLVALPIGIGVLAFILYFPPDRRQKYFRNAVPIVVIGGILNLIAAWGFLQRPFTEQTNLLVALSLVISAAAVGGLVVLRWVHGRLSLLETEFGFSLR